MAFLTYADRPGVVGTVGRVLGDAGANIGGMQVAREAAGGRALMVLTVDSQIPAAVLGQISAEIGGATVRVADLDG
jgi:D-3-phosphoglycerate dehydrogenase